ncbi:MAG: ABC transporter permease [Defluviitaleaceae bacterium]|nr:ABC transporter permease [Defluviitaleaceae bacterium]
MLIIQGAVSLGLIFSLMAIGVFLSFRILKMPDLSVEGSIILGAGMAARLVAGGVNPFLATAFAMVIGCLAGLVSGILHTKLKIPGILSGILTMVASYSIVIRIMGTSNVPLLPHGPQRVVSVFTFLTDAGLSRPNAIILFSLVIVIVASSLLYCFMGTEFGSAIRATGNNQQMVRAQGINTDVMIIACLMLSNGLVALAGALWAQQQGFASVDMGIGTIVVGLASVIIAEVLFRPRMFWTSLIAIVIGSIIYRLIIALALSVDFMRPTDLRLVTAIIVTIALCMPLIREKGAKIFARRVK